MFLKLSNIYEKNQDDDDHDIIDDNIIEIQLNWKMKSIS